jgi:enterochelin esterase family protein
MMQVFASDAPDNLLLTRLGSSDVWYRTLTMRREARFEYQFAVATSAQPDVAGARRNQPDPLNTLRYNDTSAVALPGAPAQPYVKARAGVARGNVERRRFASRILNNERDLEIYTPPGYTRAGQKYPLLIHFDLDQYGDGKVIPTPTILDNLIAEHRIMPLVAVLVGNVNRSLELPCNGEFSKFVHEELLPLARREFHVSSRAADTVVGGSSFGGLASSCAALRYPEDFGNVLSQAGLYYWEPTTLPATVVNGHRQRDIYAESNWVAQQIVQRPKLPIRFFLDAGLYDTDPTDRGVNILESNRRLKDVLRAKGYVVKYEEFFGSHDPLCWRGTLADGLMFLLGTRTANVR